jgi:protein-S-isoprenylcysteine O-methyltransferase Ste14
MPERGPRLGTARRSAAPESPSASTDRGREGLTLLVGPRRLWWRHPSPRAQRVIRTSANVVGAAGAGYFAYITLAAYLSTHRPIGLLQSAEQMVVVVAYLARRPARVVTERFGDWILAFGGTFAPVLLRPDGAHPQWGLTWGLALQFVGVTICLLSLLTLGRSFGFAAADRGLVWRGPYRIVRHPIYASYVLLQVGYLLQSLSLRNLAVVLLATGCNVGRIKAEELVLATNAAHSRYRSRVRWKMLPGVW